MPRLVFAADAVRRVVEHSINSKQNDVTDWDAYGKVDWSKPDAQVPTKPTKAPSIIFVHDDGVYLMSNGTPGDPRDAEAEQQKRDGGKTWRRFVAYAQGCNPAIDDDWYDTAHDLVGGDDFAETLPWAIEMHRMIVAGATEIIINLTASRMSLSCRRPKSKIN